MERASLKTPLMFSELGKRVHFGNSFCATSSSIPNFQHQDKQEDGQHLQTEAHIVKSSQAKPNQAKPRQIKPSQSRTSQPNQAKPSQAKPNQAKPNQDRLS